VKLNESITARPNPESGGGFLSRKLCKLEFKTVIKFHKQILVCKLEEIITLLKTIMRSKFA
jgi:hypothetical protein